MSSHHADLCHAWVQSCLALCLVPSLHPYAHAHAQPPTISRCLYRLMPLFISYWQARAAWMMYMLLIPSFPRMAVAGMTDAPDRVDFPIWLHERLPVHMNIAVGATCDLAFGCETVPDGVSETSAAAQAGKRRLLRTESLLCTHSVGMSLPVQAEISQQHDGIQLWASVWCPRQWKAVQGSASAYSSLQSALQYAKHGVTACKNLGWACLDLSQSQSGTYWLSPFLLRMPTMYDSLQC